MISPYKGTFRVSQAFDHLRANGTLHQGFDLVGISSKQLHSTVYGQVIRAGWENSKNHKQGFGLRVVLRIAHTNYFMYYGHLSQINVVAGQKVKPGNLIGTEGSTGHSTGSHLHWEIRECDVRTGYQKMPEYSGIPNVASKTAYTSGWGADLLGDALLKEGCLHTFPACVWISTLQAHLQSLAYDTGTADGIFGPKTTAAVKMFQKYMGLDADGKVGPKTKEKVFYIE